MPVSVHLGKGAKEPHDKELYCIAWSTDIHVGYEYDCVNQEESEEDEFEGNAKYSFEHEYGHMQQHCAEDVPMQITGRLKRSVGMMSASSTEGEGIEDKDKHSRFSDNYYEDSYKKSWNEHDQVQLNDKSKRDVRRSSRFSNAGYNHSVEDTIRRSLHMEDENLNGSATNERRSSPSSDEGSTPSSDDGSSASMPCTGRSSPFAMTGVEEEIGVENTDDYKYESDDESDSDECVDDPKHKHGTRKSMRLAGVSSPDEGGRKSRVLRSMVAEPAKSSIYSDAEKEHDQGHITFNGKGNVEYNDTRKENLSDSCIIKYTVDEDNCIILDDSDDCNDNSDEDSKDHNSDDDGDESMRIQTESSDSSCRIVKIESPQMNAAKRSDAQEDPDSSKCLSSSVYSLSTTYLQDGNDRIQKQNLQRNQRTLPQHQKGDLYHWYTMATCGDRHLTIYQVRADKASLGADGSLMSSINCHEKSSNGSRDGHKCGNSDKVEQVTQSTEDSASTFASASTSLKPFSETRGNSPFIGDNETETNNSFSGQKNGINSDFQVRQIYRDVDEGEIHFTVAFAGRSRYKLHLGDGDSDNDDFTRSLNPSDIEIEIKSSSPIYQSISSEELDFESDDTPQLCCVGGKRGTIKVIDTVQQSLIFTLTGHTNELYDMKACPSNEWLLISASNDETIRLWNLKVPTCIAVFAGHHGHREAVLSVDWHPLGQDFVSSGMDGTIKIWSCKEDDVRQAIQDSFSTTAQAGAAAEGGYSSGLLSKFSTVICQLPIFSTAKLHTDYIDCVKFCGDLILSKSTTNGISLWKPVLSSPEGSSDGNVSSLSIKDSGNFIHLQDYNMPACDQWYIRFGTDMECKMLAVGNCYGDIRLWEIGGAKKPHSVFNPNCSTIVRMVSLSPDGRFLAAVTDDSYVWKYHIDLS